jgi:hypothetical protein
MFENLYKQAANVLPKQFQELGELISIDGSLISAVLLMYWADYRKGSKKAKVHCGFDINRGIPSKIFLTDGNGGERPFESKILSKDQTGVMDRKGLKSSIKIRVDRSALFENRWLFIPDFTGE